MTLSATSFFETLNQKILSHKAKIAIIGLGYVGLPLALTFHKQGFSVLAFDLDTSKITALKKGHSYIKNISESAVQSLSQSPNFEASSDPEILKKADAILICVPTPLTKNREPDMSYVVSTTDTIAKHLQKGQLIVLESTTYPGTTDELMRPLLEKTGLVMGRDFFLSYSPEREDPGNPNFETASIPKVVGADDPHSRDLSVTLYEQIVPKVISVSSARTAEAVKLTENIFRSANIALVNELKVIYEKMGINIWEVIDAAKTKPFGFMPFYPGPGLGGHCIPIDPFYLTWKAREYGVSTRFVELSGEINTSMPFYVVDRLRDELDKRFSKSLNGTRLLIMGMAYKKNVDDIRESPSLVIYDLLKSKGAEVDYHDPYILTVPTTREHPTVSGLESIPLTQKNLAAYDAVLILTDHDSVDYKFLSEHSKLIIDTRNALHFLKEASHVAKA
ncbi:MAG: UDP-N-acetyl-D-glucosamine dehydrogenase [Alphaproteobacteria bacterium 16-39-46]|nr:MAG: UDP-N-acetyl-D-glucosamine dehydrogenase [Alphaproteobacteria bacterium 16-39-46]OZA44402.1 MAG: UDP-N-acetyl-D-glucosamine dehydrogenase [Alphaproteobacteria bacterium 17-39-52]HQS83287.1 nucleotide sugar dehydrogenase [Alphaproteobacteria bacterium]HQS93171.1 nucleotide sugar dehydrogenase [Alphaproteobacteria bacterium]